MAKALGQDQIKNLLRQDSKQRRETKHIADWPSKEDRKKLHKAATTHATTVELSGGIFDLKYDTRNSIAWEEYEVVFASPADGKYVPCGWFRIKSLLAGT